MKKITPATLEAIASAPVNAPKNWIKVGLDTGGIAAGARYVFDALAGHIAYARHPISLLRTGSNGLSFADPVVEIECAGMPHVLYGNIHVADTKTLLDEHIIKHRILEDHVVATRDRGTKCEGDTTVILVQDTSAEQGDRTRFFQDSFIEEVRRQGLQGKVQVVRAMDMGIYKKGLVVQLLPSAVTYENVLAANISEIIMDTVKKGIVLEKLLHREPDPQVRIVMRNCGRLDPESLDDALRHGAYQGLKSALLVHGWEKTIGVMKASALRGRGGAGFPTWLKWKLTRDNVADQKYVICNGDEGDPGAFMDRSVLEGDPHTVLEGLMIAGLCTGATKGFFYIRAEYPLAVARIQLAIDQAKEAGLLGKNILGSDFEFDAEIRLGAGAFVCGEETALIASIEGKRGSPSPRPPFPSVSGLWGKPTSINNVETLAAIPAILCRGGEWYAQYGIGESRGTKVFAVTGKVNLAQLVEVPMGVTLHKIVYDICGGVSNGESIQAVQTGGPSGGVIPESLLDTPISYENLMKLGSIMGSGGMLVMDSNNSMVDVARFYLRFCVDESCGKCAPCRIGGYQMLQILERIFKGHGKADDIPKLKRICHAMQNASLCGLGQTAPNPVLSTLRYFEAEYMAFIEGGVTYARKIRKQLEGVGQKAS
ncbi:MAG: NADH-ubiquinone oxidoreductase-F iron-sulfur binding region domain-containing protein [Verrucomicrobiota bacterium]|nr:NADH-ubiquinone oxidoreductase-F iron-sulfur binding region domain-containing protein [Verrucomicrobiota bacterium]